MIIGIDHGFGMIKTRNTSFKAGLDSFDFPPAISSSEYVEWNGKFYALSGTRQPLRRSKTGDDNYFVLTMMAIAKEARERNRETKFPATLAVGLPIAVYRQEEAAFHDYLLREGGRLNFSFCGQPYDVVVEDVRVFPQGYSAVLSQMGQLKQEPVVHVIDMGSWTTDTVTLKEGYPDGDSEHSYDIGVIRCIDWIQDKVLGEFGRKYSVEQIESVLWDRQASIPSPVKDAIKTRAREWLEGFMAKLVEAGFDPSTAMTWFIGGGAYLLAQFYKDDHKAELLDATFLTDISANAVGYENACTIS